MAQEPQEEEFVSTDTFLEMTARLLGRIHALEATLVAVLATRPELCPDGKIVDRIILNDEASRIETNHTDEATMQTHEWARQAAEAILENVRVSRRLK